MNIRDFSSKLVKTVSQSFAYVSWCRWAGILAIALFFLSARPLYAVEIVMDSGTTLDLHDVWGASSSDVWAVGTNGISGNTGELNIRHYDGTSWSSTTASSQLRSTLFPQINSTTYSPYTFTSVFGNASDNVYAIAKSEQGTTLVSHYDGNQWDLWRDFGSFNQSSIYVAPDNDVFTGGSNISRSLGQVIQFFDADGSGAGKVAKPFAIFNAPEPNDPEVLPFATGAQPRFGVPLMAGTGEANVFATGVENDFIHFDGTQFSDVSWFSQTLNNTIPVLPTTASDLEVVENGNGTSSLLVAYGAQQFGVSSTAVAMFEWDGAILTPAGTTGLDSVLLGDGMPGGGGGEIAIVPGFASNGTTASGVEGVVGINGNDVYNFDFNTGVWNYLTTAANPLKDVFAFADGTMFVVGEDGLILGPNSGSSRFVWDNSVETLGDNNFDGMTNGPTNWLNPATGQRHPSIVDNADYEINNGAVELYENPLLANSIRATGQFDVSNDLYLRENSSIENMTLRNAGLEIDAELRLSGSETVLENAEITAGTTNSKLVIDTDLRQKGPLNSIITPYLEVPNAAHINVDSGTLILSGGGDIESAAIRFSNRGSAISFENNTTNPVEYDFDGWNVQGYGTVRVADNVKVSIKSGFTFGTLELDGGDFQFSEYSEISGRFCVGGLISCPKMLDWRAGAIEDNGDLTQSLVILGDMFIRNGGPKRLSANLFNSSIDANGFNLIEDSVFLDNAIMRFGLGYTYFDSGQVIALSDPFNNSYVEVGPGAEFRVESDTPVIVQSRFNNLGAVRVNADVNESQNSAASFVMSGDIDNLSGTIGEGILKNGKWVVARNGVISFSDISGRTITTIGKDAYVTLSENGSIPQLDLRRLEGRYFLDSVDRTISPFDIGHDGVFWLSGDSNVSTQGNMTNQGEFRIATDSIFTIDGVFEGRGAELIDGILQVENLIFQNGRVQGTGNVQARSSILNEVSRVILGQEVTVAPGNSYGVLTFEADEYIHGAGSVLEIEIGGELPGINMDLLVVNGNVVLDGVLVLLFDDNFLPTTNQMFEFMRVSGNIVGDFAEVRVRNKDLIDYTILNDAGRLFITNLQISSLTAVPEPMSVALFGFGLAGLGIAARRRKTH